MIFFRKFKSKDITAQCLNWSYILTYIYSVNSSIKWAKYIDEQYIYERVVWCIRDRTASATTVNASTGSSTARATDTAADMVSNNSIQQSCGSG